MDFGKFLNSPAGRLKHADELCGELSGLRVARDKLDTNKLSRNVPQCGRQHVDLLGRELSQRRFAGFPHDRRRLASVPVGRRCSAGTWPANACGTWSSAPARAWGGAPALRVPDVRSAQPGVSSSRARRLTASCSSFGESKALRRSRTSARSRARSASRAWISSSARSMRTAASDSEGRSPA